MSAPLLENTHALFEALEHRTDTKSSETWAKIEADLREVGTEVARLEDLVAVGQHARQRLLNALSLRDELFGLAPDAGFHLKDELIAARKDAEEYILGTVPGELRELEGQRQSISAQINHAQMRKADQAEIKNLELDLDAVATLIDDLHTTSAARATELRAKIRDAATAALDAGGRRLALMTWDFSPIERDIEEGRRAAHQLVELRARLERRIREAVYSTNPTLRSTR